jgi:hypothetical protein
MNVEQLSIEDLKLIRKGLNKVPITGNPGILDTVKRVDAILTTHNLKFEMVALPKRKYQRGTQYEYVFKAINK